jgi:hypothetical protein
LTYDSGFPLFLHRIYLKMPAHHWTTLDERAFLTSKIPDFRTAQEGGMLTRFWVELEGAWFLRYPMEAKVGVRAHDVPGPPLTDEENKRLGAATAVQKAMGVLVLIVRSDD